MAVLTMMMPSHWGLAGLQIADSFKSGLALIQNGEPAAVPFGIFMIFGITALTFKTMLGVKKTI